MYLRETNSSSSQRNYGIDLLRIVAAFYVVVLHTVLQGGLNRAASPGSYQYLTCQCLTGIAFCAVNLFGIISGYVGYRDTAKGFNLTGYLMLWLEMVFYGVLLTLYYMWKLPGTVTLVDLSTMFLPLTHGLHWYFTCYTALYFLIPFLNTGISHCRKEILIPLFLVILLLFTPLEAVTEHFGTNGGYSLVWLLILYLTGAIMKKYQLCQKITLRAALVSILIVNICILLLRCYQPSFTVLHITIDAEIMSRYTCPLYLYNAIAHVVLFSKFRPTALMQKLIAFAASASFTVCIINGQKFVYHYGIANQFQSWVTSSPPGIVIRVIAFSLLFVAAVSVIDYFRRKLFQLLGVKAALAHLVDSIPTTISR